HASHPFGQFGDHFDPFAPFGSGDPGELQPLEVNPDEFEEFPEGGKASSSVEVAGHVVAVSRMAAGDEDAVGPFLEGAQDEDRVDSPGAGELEHPDVARVLHPAGAGQVRSGVGAPGADEDYYFPFEVVFQFFSMHKLKPFTTKARRTRRKPKSL